MKRSIRGFSLIEVLVAVLVVSLGMLGIASAMFAAMHSASSNYARQEAVQYAYDILDRMRSNHSTAAEAGSPYTVGLALPGAEPSPNCTSATCTGAEMAAYDVWEWQSMLHSYLPQGLGSVSVAATSGSSMTYTATITVQWSDRSGASAFNTAPASASSSTLATQAITLTSVITP